MIDSPSPTGNIALLIDADNAPASRIDFIIAELASYGVVNIRRAYGNWKKESLKSWENVLHDYAIQPVQHFDITKGKNASDMALLIEAMDMLYTKRIDTFCIVSSDCDFTPLTLRLRADGKQVIGFGEKKSPTPFVNSCTRFLYLDEVRGESAKPQPNQLSGDTKLMNLLRNAIAAVQDEDGWAALGPVGSHISNQGSFDVRNFGFGKLSDLFAAIGEFELRSEKSGTGTRHWVRRKQSKRGGTSS